MLLMRRQKLRELKESRKNKLSRGLSNTSNLWSWKMPFTRDARCRAGIWSASCCGTSSMISRLLILIFWLRLYKLGPNIWLNLVSPILCRERLLVGLAIKMTVFVLASCLFWVNVILIKKSNLTKKILYPLQPQQEPKAKSQTTQSGQTQWTQLLRCCTIHARSMSSKTLTI